jgi:hypothetical protein
MVVVADGLKKPTLDTLLYLVSSGPEPDISLVFRHGPRFGKIITWNIDMEVKHKDLEENHELT